MDECAVPGSKCIMIQRTIVDLKNYLDDDKAKPFADIVYNDRSDVFEIEPEANRLLSDMKTHAIQEVTNNNVLSYDVLWRYDDVISPTLHKDYLDKLCSELTSKLKALIDNQVPKNLFHFDSEYVEECLHHWLKCQDIARTFCGRRHEYTVLHQYISGTYNQPMIVFGPTGSSKTSMLSKLAMDVSSP